MADEDYIEIPERLKNSRHKMRREDWDSIQVLSPEPEKEHKTDITEASISLEKVGVLMTALLGIIGTAVTGWISLNQHISNINSEVSNIKVTTDAKISDLGEKITDFKERLLRLENDVRSQDKEISEIKSKKN